jgi:hypothetical protein
MSEQTKEDIEACIYYGCMFLFLGCLFASFLPH